MIAILMGSKSDYEIVAPAFKLLKRYEVPFEARVLSAHRTQLLLRDFVNLSKAKIFIAAAGGAAHLAGAIAALTLRPVIGIPIASEGKLDSLLSTVQMPPGVPVATVAINGAENAAILAMQMLGIADESFSRIVDRDREERHAKVVEQDKELIRLVDALQ